MRQTSRERARAVRAARSEGEIDPLPFGTRAGSSGGRRSLDETWRHRGSQGESALSIYWRAAHLLVP
jgi:hypothetical protein